MIVLIDTDILIDVALRREPFFKNAVKVIDCIQNGKVKGFVAWHSLSNLYYMTSPKIKSMGSRDFIYDLCQFVNVAKADTKHMLYALDLKMNDFEDAMQSAAATACRADLIITRNVKDYRNSPVTACSPVQFLKMDGKR